MIKYNLEARCSGGFKGLLAHSRKSRYYFLCKRSAVLTCMCRSKEFFSKVRLRCEKKRRLNARDEREHQVVENIIQKYKCAVMIPETTPEPVTFIAYEVNQHNPVII